MHVVRQPVDRLFIKAHNTVGMLVIVDGNSSKAEVSGQGTNIDHVELVRCTDYYIFDDMWDH